MINTQGQMPYLPTPEEIMDEEKELFWIPDEEAGLDNTPELIGDAPDRIWIDRTHLDRQRAAFVSARKYRILSSDIEYVRSDIVAAEIERLQEKIARWHTKIYSSADIIQRNYLHQPEKCADAASICWDVALDMRQTLGRDLE